MVLSEVFILSCFLGYFAIWRVTPMLHSSLMSVTNAVSGIVFIGAINAFEGVDESKTYFLYVAIFLAMVNIFGGFYVSAKMLNMFKLRESSDGSRD